MTKLFSLVFCIFLVGSLIAPSISAQTTQFAYQGALKDGVNNANGNYDFQFALFDSASAGNQVGTTITQNSVTVANGVFSVPLDFGNQFPGASRFLEIRVRQSGAGSFTTLVPRVSIGASPYGIRTLTAGQADSATNATSANNALSLGGVAANQYVVTTDPRMTDARPPTAGSTSYIQNTTTQQTSSNFNISGNGTVGGALTVNGNSTSFGTLSGNAVNAQTQFNINGNRALLAGNNNVFTGINAGDANTTGIDNSFFGRDAGMSNTSGSSNSFFGFQAGQATVTNGFNSFFGSLAGTDNTAGNNAFFGRSSGQFNTTGTQNSFFGTFSGRQNLTGNDNTYFGYQTGQNVTTSSNAFFGSQAGANTTTGGGNTFFGAFTALDNTTGSDNAFFGTNTGRGTTSGSRNTFIGRLAGRFNTTGTDNTYIGYNAVSAPPTGTSNTAIGANATIADGLTFATAIGAGSSVTASNTLVLGRAGTFAIVPGALTVQGTASVITLNATDANIETNLATDHLVVDSIDAGGAVFTDAFFVGYNSFNSVADDSVCYEFDSDRNFYRIGHCPLSNIRYQTNVKPLKAGLEAIKRLRPVTFNWRSNGKESIGLVAEEAKQVEPLLTTTDKLGEVEDVHYNGVTVTLVNAVKEQQTQIEAQQHQIEEQRKKISQQQTQIDELKQILCSFHADAKICSAK